MPNTSTKDLVSTILCDVYLLIYSLTTHPNVCLSASKLSRLGVQFVHQSLSQRLEDYWLGLRLQNMDIPAIQLINSDQSQIDETLSMTEACDLYLRPKVVSKNKVFDQTANGNTGYVISQLGDKPIGLYSIVRCCQVS